MAAGSLVTMCLETGGEGLILDAGYYGECPHCLFDERDRRNIRDQVLSQDMVPGSRKVQSMLSNL